MRAHRLSELGSFGGVTCTGLTGSLDLYDFSQVSEFHLEWLDGPLPTLTLTLLGERHSIDVVAEGVVGLELRPFASQLWLPEIEIEDLSTTSQEDIRCGFVAHGGRELSFQSRTLKLCVRNHETSPALDDSRLQREE